jgi:hypothetical protein
LESPEQKSLNDRIPFHFTGAILDEDIRKAGGMEIGKKSCGADL